jgi:hypothetical protein
MGLGSDIGTCARLTQNNSAAYVPGGYSRSTHIALMGDPTLRTHVLAPASALTAQNAGGGVTISWTASVDPVDGYHVYRGDSLTGPLARLTVDPVQALQYVDTSASGAAVYMVRAASVYVSPSGTYHNLSQGVFDSLQVGVVSAWSRAPDLARSVRLTGVGAQRTLCITLPGAVATPSRVALYTADGRLVCRLRAATRERSVRMPLGRHGKGTYVVTVRDGRSVHTRTVVVY